MVAFPRPLRGAALLACTLLGACVYDNGPFDPGDRPFVEGRWRIDARVVSSGCGFVGDESFTVRAIQSRDLLQLVVDIVGFGDIRYDGRIERDGDFTVSQRTVFPDERIRDESTVDGRFDRAGRTLQARETEWITDLSTGRSCVIEWRWFGDRR